VVRFARLIHRRGRDLGGPSARAAFGGNLSLPWLPLAVMPRERRGVADAGTRSGRGFLMRTDWLGPSGAVRDDRCQASTSDIPA